MTNQDKQQIETLFKEKAERMGLSMEKAAIAAGTKGTTISQVFSGKYGANDEQIYKLLARWVEYSSQGWKNAQTTNQNIMNGLLEDAQRNSHVYAITGRAGCGKTYTTKRYCETHRNAFMLQCNEYWNRKQFLRELLTQMGRDAGGMTVPELLDNAIAHIYTLDSPILILDEADKLSDQVIYFFITLYNKLEDHCGIVLLATDYLNKRLRRGLDSNRRGYAEIWSRIGRKPKELVFTKAKDVAGVCWANGIKDAAVIEAITNESEGDLRRVKIAVHKAKLLTQ